MLTDEINDVLVLMDDFLQEYPNEELASITVLTRAANRGVEIGVGYAEKDAKYGYFATGEHKSLALTTDVRELRDFLYKAVVSYLDKDDFVWILDRKQVKDLIASLTDDPNCNCIHHKFQ